MKLVFASLWLALSALLFQTDLDTRSLIGIVRNGDTGEVLPGAQLKLLRRYALVHSVVADDKGQYKLSVEAGRYDLECSFPGFVTKRITGVLVPESGKDLPLNLSLRPGAVLEEVSAVDFDTYLRLLETDEITIKGSRKDGDAYYLDGVRATDTPPAIHDAAPATVEDVAAPMPAPEEPMLSEVVVASRATKAKTFAKTSEKSKMKASGMAASKRKEASDLRVRDEVEVDDAKMPAPGGAPAQPTPRAGLLTAGEWNDLNNWSRHWTDLLNDGEIDAYQKMYTFYPKHRYTVLLTNEQDFPIADAAVTLFSAAGEALWESRTDNTGKAELWAGLFADQRAPERVSAKVSFNADKGTQDLGELKPVKDGINRRKIATACDAPQNVDIVWAVDATGSMGDEIEYLKTELLDVIGRAKSLNPNLSFRMGTVFYRDKGDDYLTQSSGLSYEIGKTVDFIRNQFAGGGGDYPEAVESALEEAVYNQRWSERAIARICFLVLDASPHQSAEVNESLQRSIREAARRGIRVVPVAASGIQKDTEFLMKFFGLATNGTYVFLTDHSGVGGKHIEATTDEYKVEPLNALLVRLLAEYTAIKTCEGKSAIRFEDPQQPGHDWQALYYPNPAFGQFTLELPVDVQTITLYDAEGKAVKKLEKAAAGTHTIPLGDVSDGVYTIRIHKDNQWQSGKLVVAGR